MESPTKSQKQLIREKRKKKQAFQSFLQKGQNTSSFTEVHNQSDHEQDADDNPKNICNICKVALGDRKKFCGFCRNAACNEHMRKKRKNKEINKFVRICDGCEDRQLYNKHMKLQLKQQQSLSAQQSIVTSKKIELEEQLNGKKIKLEMLYNKQKQLLQDKQSADIKFKSQSNDIKNKMNKIEKKMEQINAMQEQLQRLEQKTPPSLEEDYNSLELQNSKVVKQLVKYEKLCTQAIKSKSKKEKQIYDEYKSWQNQQKMKRSKKDEEDCCIF